jgi:hypothetical protein
MGKWELEIRTLVFGVCCFLVAGGACPYAGATKPKPKLKEVSKTKGQPVMRMRVFAVWCAVTGLSSNYSNAASQGFKLSWSIQAATNSSIRH